MRFGQGGFAIECVPLPARSVDDWRFGALTYCIGAMRLGGEEECTFNAALPAFERIAANAGRRHCKELFGMESAAAFSLAWTELYGSDATDPNAWERYGPLMAIPTIDCFDPWKAFLVENAGESRLLWKRVHDPGSSVYEVRLVTGEFDKVVSATIEWLRAYLSSPA